MSPRGGAIGVVSRVGEYLATRDSRKALSCVLDVGGEATPLAPVTWEAGMGLGEERGVSTDLVPSCWVADSTSVPFS